VLLLTHLTLSGFRALRVGPWRWLWRGRRGHAITISMVRGRGCGFARRPPVVPRDVVAPLGHLSQAEPPFGAAHAEIRAIQQDARADGGPTAGTPPWPATVLRTPKGWSGPQEVNNIQVEG